MTANHSAAALGLGLRELVTDCIVTAGSLQVRAKETPPPFSLSYAAAGGGLKRRDQAA
jgi:hypothetical protein